MNSTYQTKEMLMTDMQNMTELRYCHLVTVLHKRKLGYANIGNNYNGISPSQCHQMLCICIATYIYSTTKLLLCSNSRNKCDHETISNVLTLGFVVLK